MLGVPIAYPRLVWLENLLTSGVMTPVRMLARHGLMDGTLNEFDGTIEILDDLNDHWCAARIKRSATSLLPDYKTWLTPVMFALLFSLVMCILLPSAVFVHVIPRFPAEADHRLMLNVVSSAITNTPPPASWRTF